MSHLSRLFLLVLQSRQRPVNTYWYESSSIQQSMRIHFLSRMPQRCPVSGQNEELWFSDAFASAFMCILRSFRQKRGWKHQKVSTLHTELAPSWEKRKRANTSTRPQPDVWSLSELLSPASEHTDTVRRQQMEPKEELIHRPIWALHMESDRWDKVRTPGGGWIDLKSIQQKTVGKGNQLTELRVSFSTLLCVLVPGSYSRCLFLFFALDSCCAFYRSF